MSIKDDFSKLGVEDMEDYTGIDSSKWIETYGEDSSIVRDMNHNCKWCGCWPRNDHAEQCPTQQQMPTKEQLAMRPQRDDAADAFDYLALTPEQKSVWKNETEKSNTYKVMYGGQVKLGSTCLLLEQCAMPVDTLFDSTRHSLVRIQDGQEEIGAIDVDLVTRKIIFKGESVSDAAKMFADHVNAHLQSFNK